MLEAGLLGLKHEKALSINKGEVDLLLISRRIRKYFQVDEEDRSTLIDTLDLRSLILFRLILEYKVKYPPLIIKIRKLEYYDFLKKGDLNIPIDISIILVRSGIVIPLADEDYEATWKLLNILKDKCNFIVFPTINIES